MLKITETKPSNEDQRKTKLNINRNYSNKIKQVRPGYIFNKKDVLRRDLKDFVLKFLLCTIFLLKLLLFKVEVNG